MRGACFKVMSGVVSYIITVPILFPWGGGGGLSRNLFSIHPCGTLHCSILK